jgi:RNA polymerase-binding transcription factor DksA
VSGDIDVGDDGKDPGERSAPPATGTIGDDLALLDQVDEVLSGVERALRRLDDGSYGTCEICGAALPEDQVEADPILARCASHAG